MNAGAAFREDQSGLTDSASSVYEFKALDIHKEELSLDSVKQKVGRHSSSGFWFEPCTYCDGSVQVCLIVNVASY